MKSCCEEILQDGWVCIDDLLPDHLLTNHLLPDHLLPGHLLMMHETKTELSRDHDHLILVQRRGPCFSVPRPAMRTCLLRPSPRYLKITAGAPR